MGQPEQSSVFNVQEQQVAHDQQVHHTTLRTYEDEDSEHYFLKKLFNILWMSFNILACLWHDEKSTVAVSTNS